MQKEKDKFFLETGYTTEQVSIFLREREMKRKFEEMKSQQEKAQVAEWSVTNTTIRLIFPFKN